MSEANEVSKDLNVVDNDLKVEVKDDPSTEEVASHLEKAEENPMPSPAQEEAVIKKKYGGLLPRKTPLISKDHDRAFFDSADWALGKGSQKSKGPLEALRPKLQPTPHQQARSRRSAYAPADEGEGRILGEAVSGDSPGQVEYGRPFLATLSTALIQINKSSASDSLPDDPMTVLNRVHPPRPDWYEEFYAGAMDRTMKTYEAEIAGLKSQLFANLTGKKAAKILEIGIGTGPNLKYYGGAASGVSVVGVDPNRKMEKYAQAAAEASGLHQPNFMFIQAVGEALPVSDGSMDAVVGTLVLCSVEDVNKTLQEIKRVLKPGGLYIFVEHVAAKDGTFLKVIQRVLDPLQQTVADGCHLTRETGDSISAAGFSSVDIKTAFLSSASLINPHAYGIALK
nr:methyltransferase-like protein 7A isoform X1 [Tanacetum cinerariifolium]